MPATAVRLDPDFLERARPHDGLAEFTAIQDLARHEAGPDEVHDLPDHQFAPAGFGGRDDAAAFGDRQRHRLFQQYMLAGLKCCHCQLAMQVMRSRDCDGVDRTVVEHRAPVAIWPAAMFGGESFGRRQFLRAHRDEAGVRKLRNRACVKGAEISGAQNANPQHCCVP
jgi:hypothetical protein